MHLWPEAPYETRMAYGCAYGAHLGTPRVATRRREGQGGAAKLRVTDRQAAGRLFIPERLAVTTSTVSRCGSALDCVTPRALVPPGATQIANPRVGVPRARHASA